MANVPPITDSDFEEKVLKSEVPVLVDFSAEWCGPCKQIAPIIAKLAQDLAPGVAVFGCDVGECPETAQKFGIMSIPTLIVFKGGEEKARQVGAVPESKIRDLINKA